MGEGLAAGSSRRRSSALLAAPVWAGWSPAGASGQGPCCGPAVAQLHATGRQQAADLQQGPLLPPAQADLLLLPLPAAVPDLLGRRQQTKERLGGARTALI